MRTRERIKTATFLEVINDDDVSEIDLTKDILKTRHRFAKKVIRTQVGYEFYYQTFDGKREIKMELIHAPRFSQRMIKTKDNETFDTWVARIYGE